MNPVRSAAVIGLGLIGGSLARDLAARGTRVLAADLNATAVDDAIAQGIVTARVTDFAGVDAILVAVPVRQAAAVLEDIARRGTSARVVMDAGSTKALIVATASSLAIADRFVGCHPLAGDHRSGWAASRAGLFEDARVFLCSTPATTNDAIDLATRFWTGLGARPERIDAATHDDRVARTSHVPQVLSTALANAMAASGIAPGELGRGGRDMTRLAASSAEMWTDICLDNALALTAALGSYERNLSRLMAALEKKDAAELRSLFEEGRTWMTRR